MRRAITVMLLVCCTSTSACNNSSKNSNKASQTLDRAGFIAELRSNFPKYRWPSDYKPNLATLARYSAPPVGSTTEPGASLLVLGIYSQCAWELSWSAAFERGDTRTAAAALRQLTDYVPTLQDATQGGRAYSLRIARLAKLGDTGPAVSDAQNNCGPNFWKAHP